jgi:hypothetical protein
MAAILAVSNRVGPTPEETFKKIQKEISQSPTSVAAISKLWAYEKNEARDEIALKWYKGDAEDVTIPDYIGKCPVRAIGVLDHDYKRFRPFVPQNIKNLIIPSGVVSIRPFVFRGCYEFETITVPDSMTEIPKEAFYRCKRPTVICSKGSAAQSFAKAHQCRVRLTPEGVD